ncbi:hypothetical protein WP2W18C05_10570 [Aeromonas sp. WP2-W18-CRE-05]|nr:hypothetical protein WP2W18C05_10570 [Aeromonas sp. WP2-W18-CRE-05]
MWMAFYIFYIDTSNLLFDQTDNFFKIFRFTI